MGEKNNQINKYLSDNGRFADFFNANLFSGKKIIQPEELSTRDTKTVHRRNGTKKSREAIRDIVKIWDMSKLLKGTKEKGILLSILCLETQNTIHYAMPVRMICYESDQYEEQFKEIASIHRQKRDLQGDEYISGISKEDRLCPVISFVLYLGQSPWDGPKNLYSMLPFDLYPANFRAMMQKYTNDHVIHLLDVHSLQDKLYHSELKEVFTVLSLQNNKDSMKKYILENDKIHNISREAGEILATYLGITNLAVKEEGETMSLCKALQEWSDEERTAGMNEGRAEGFAKGRVEGRAEGRAETTDKIIRNMLYKNQSPEFISEVTAQPLEYVYQVKQATSVKEKTNYDKECNNNVE